jgi:hypothetical protein
MVVVTRALSYFDILRVSLEWKYHAYFLELFPYPFISLVSGLAFFIMGSNYWGRCYMVGGAFFLIGMLMTLDLTLGPLCFGLLWSIVLTMLGLHLRRQSKSADNAATTPLSQMPTVQFKDQK